MSRLHDEMNVVGLEREMDHSKSLRPAVPNRALEDIKAVLISNRRPHLKINVQGGSGGDLFPRAMGHSLRVDTLSSRARSQASALSLIDIEI